MPHISFLTYGTRGDVEQFLALALHYKERGFEISFAAPVWFKTLDWKLWHRISPLTKTPIQTHKSSNAAFRDLVNNPIYAENAKKLSLLIEKEDGLDKTAQTILDLFGLY